MFLINALKRIFGGREDEEEHRDHYPINPPAPSSLSPPRRAIPANHHSHSPPRPPLPSALFLGHSRGNLKTPAATNHGDGTLTVYPVTRSSETSLSSKFPSHSLSSTLRASPAPAPAPVSSTSSTVSATRNPIDREKLVIWQDSASLSPSIRSSAALAPRMKSSPSQKASCSAPNSSTNSSISGAPINVWQVNLSIPPDSATRSSEKPSVSCPDTTSWEDSPPLTSFPLSTEEKLLEPGLNRKVLPKYEIPKHLEEMIKKDVVPPVLKCPLSPSTYADYFATLLYAEDFYIEKWSKYLLLGVTLDNHPSKNLHWISKKNESTRDFVAFEIDSVPERRPYLLSRDFVFVQPVNEIDGPFKGRIFRVVKSSTVLVEFGDDFHSQHSPSKRYNVSFSFNRVCLKRAHQAISAAAYPSFLSILFPDQSLASEPNTIHLHENFNFHLSVRRIVNHKGPLPFLIEGPPSVDIKVANSDQNDKKCLFITGEVIQEAIIEIYRISPSCRILICSPSNKTSDVLLRSLRKEIPDFKLFRANAAYRNYDCVPDDIIPASLYEEEEECFACPPLADLLTFNIITSTFMSSFRLHAAGIDTEHFTHIFLVDASYATEPEAIVPLANLAGKNTAIVVAGSSNKFPAWVRADIARRNGLKRSYFHRLWKG